MAKKLVIASNNAHKIEEIKAMLNGKFELVSLADIGCTDEIPEDADTLEGNALQKAMYVYERYGLECFADDTGLEVAALNGKPGVHSARFSVPEVPNAPAAERSKHNIEKLLRLLQTQQNKNAAFRTIICLVQKNGPHYFEGKIEGKIIAQCAGSEGFGYDPVFVPKGYAETFAQMPAETKNAISHRAIATNKLISYLLAQ
jgi:XTP/dITP diphosphohydrolase